MVNNMVNDMVNDMVNELQLFTDSNVYSRRQMAFCGEVCLPR